MATDVVSVSVANKPGLRSVWKSLLLTTPMLIWAFLMVGHNLPPERAMKIAALVTGLFMAALFFFMMRTRKTYRWRRIYFVSLGVLFPIGFIHQVIAMRGTMGIPMEEMIAGRTPFCFLPIPMLLLPAALYKTVVFPGSILPGSGMAGGGMAAMVAIWLGMSLVIGKAWCSYACFFGGIEEGVAALPRKPIIKKIDSRWRYGPWAVLLATSLLSLALFDSVYCMWLCPFKAVSEYVAARNLTMMVQNGVFILLFASLVILLPFLTKKRTQCSFLCPFGAFQSLFNKINIFDVKVDQSKCKPCNLCENACPTLSINKQSAAEGKTLMSCMKCGACVDVCPRDAAAWHIKGTQLGLKPETARLLFLYSAWAMAMMFGSGTIIQGLGTILKVFL